MTAAKRVCRYLKGTIEIKLVYTETVCEAVGYLDADWASSVDDRHSTSGNVMLIAGGAVSWLSKRQATVALSTAEAECVIDNYDSRSHLDSKIIAVFWRERRHGHSV